jgi:tetratricopeptide (TPR) repeat protein
VAGDPGVDEEPVGPPSALLFDVGYDLVAGGEPEKGGEVFELFVDRYPWAAMAHAGLGFARKELEEAEAARQSLQRALELDPENGFARRLLREMGE